MRWALLLCLSVVPAAAQDSLTEACENEKRLLCPDERGQKALDCLGEDPTLLTARCRAALREAEAAAAEAREAQGADADEGPAREARLVGVTGTVYLHPAGRPEGEYVAASSGVPLSAGDWIRVGEGGSASLAIEGDTFVSLSSGTDMGVTSLAAAGVELRLALGSLAAKVRKLDLLQAFRVRTPTAVAGVRGTELLVEVDDSADCRVGVVDEGRVEVESDGGETVQLEAGEETRAFAGRPLEAPRPLRDLAPRAERFGALRRDAARTASAWRPMEPGRMSRLRSELRSRPVQPGGGLRGLSPGQQRQPAPGSRFRDGGPGGRQGGSGDRQGGPGGRQGPGNRQGGAGDRQGMPGGTGQRQGPGDRQGGQGERRMGGPGQPQNRQGQGQHGQNQGPGNRQGNQNRQDGPGQQGQGQPRGPQGPGGPPPGGPPR